MTLIGLIPSALAQHISPEFISPDGALVVKAGGNHDVDAGPSIESRYGSKVFFTMEGNGEKLEGGMAVADFAEPTPIYVVWNQDSSMVALGFRVLNNCERTYVLRRHGDTFILLHLPIHEEDSYIIPLRWDTPNSLVLEVSAPYGGRAAGQDASFYVYTATFKFNPSSGAFDKVKTTTKRYPYKQ
jgi:hypothetical protein